MDTSNVKDKLCQARLSLDEMRACERKAFGNNTGKFEKALSDLLGAGKSAVYRFEKIEGYNRWREGWDLQNPSEDTLLKYMHDKRDTDVHERPSDYIPK